VTLSIDDGPVFDLGLLRRGTFRLNLEARVSAASLLRGEEYLCERIDIDLLMALSSTEWVARSEIETHGSFDQDVVDRGIARGLVLTDDTSPTAVRDRRRDEDLRAVGWERFAATYHFLSRWRDVEAPNARAPSGDVLDPGESVSYLRSLVEAYGEPPPHFHRHPQRQSTVMLPHRAASGELEHTLVTRRTTRAFDVTIPLSLDDLSHLLLMTWGCHGVMPVIDDVVGLKKTSPSGGDLHPTEVYVLAQHVDELATGVYHYDVQHHSLDLIEPISPDEVRTAVSKITAGQEYFGDAHALFLMTTRFGRNYWKYRAHPLAYRVIHLDVGHLSQSLYLLATASGLGVFFSAAVNHLNMEELLHVDGIHEAALAVAGCGHPAKEPPELTFTFEPYSHLATASTSTAAGLRDLRRGGVT
jgi:putative peptide maturation dehydrogenase